MEKQEIWGKAMTKDFMTRHPEKKAEFDKKQAAMGPKHGGKTQDVLCSYVSLALKNWAKGPTDV